MKENRPSENIYSFGDFLQGYQICGSKATRKEFHQVGIHEKVSKSPRCWKASWNRPHDFPIVYDLDKPARFVWKGYEGQ
jgi:hypothetical protein